MARGGRGLAGLDFGPHRPESTAAPWHPSLPLGRSQTPWKRELTGAAEEDTEPSERQRRGCPGAGGERNVLPQSRKAPDSSGLRGCGEERPRTPEDPARGAGSQPPSREHPPRSRDSGPPPPLLPAKGFLFLPSGLEVHISHPDSPDSSIGTGTSLPSRECPQPCRPRDTRTCQSSKSLRCLLRTDMGPSLLFLL